MYRLALIFFSALVLVSAPAMAKDGRSTAWIVTQLSGDARVVHGGLQPASLRANAMLSPGDVIMTGRTGRATLSREADYIVIAPQSELRLPSTPQPNGFTRVRQNVGTMLFKVQHTGIPHFAVDTPMLAAVVKGTTFTIVVDRNRSAVQVTQGVVQVTANDGGMQQLVEGGKTVFINHSDPKMIIDADSQPAKASVTTSAAVKVSGSGPVSLVSITNLTSGLVRAAAPSRSPSSQTPTVAVIATPVTAPVTAPALNASGPGPVAPGLTEPVVDIAETTVPAVVEPVVDVVQTTGPAVVEPVVNIVETTVPAVAEPVVDVVQNTVPAVVEPVVNIVETAVPVVEPIVNIVETTVPAVVEPVVEVVQTTVPTVVEPVVDIVETVPAVVEPVVEVVQTTVPAVVEPVVGIVDTTVQVLGGLFHP
jgi:hypothetical protein